MKKSQLPLPSSPKINNATKYAVDSRTGEPWSPEEDPWERNIKFKTDSLSNAEKIKSIIDTQIELMFKKSLSGKVLDSRELQTLVTCAGLIKDVKELDKEVTKIKDMTKLSSDELKAKLK